MQRKKETLIAMIECGIMAALAAVLSGIRIYHLPLGGSVTLLSMLPTAVFSVRRGGKWGLTAGFLQALIQLAMEFGEVIGWGLTPAALAACVLLDYLLAFTVIGLAGILRSRGRWGMVTGTGIALFLRFLCHLISGVVIFDIWLPEGWDNVFLYSVVYNGSFMLPELIFTAAAMLILTKTAAFRAVLKRF